MLANNKLHNVLYISYDGMTDPLGQSQVLPYLTSLSKKGYNITLLSCEKPERFTQHKSVIENICSAAAINWQPVLYTSTPPVISTIKDIRVLYKRAYDLHARHMFSIVHCRSYISAMVGQSMKKKFGTKFLFDMRGFWADERVDGGLWNRKNPLFNLIYKYFKKKERQYLQEADRIISLTHAGNDILQARKDVRQPLPVTVIPCCVDTELFNPANINEEQKQTLRRQLGISDEQAIIGYVGSIGTWYMLNEMLMGFKAFKEKDKNARMLFVTTEPKSMVLDAAIRLGIDANDIVVTPAARKEVPLYISLMQYSIFFIKPCFSKMASSPTKQGEIMAMGIPVLCNTGVGDTEYVVNKYNSGVALSDFTTAGYEAAISKLTTTQYNSSTIRDGAIDFYSLAKGVAAYEGVYRQLLKQ